MGSVAEYRSMGNRSLIGAYSRGLTIIATLKTLDNLSRAEKKYPSSLRPTFSPIKLRSPDSLLVPFISRSFSRSRIVFQIDLYPMVMFPLSV